MPPFNVLWTIFNLTRNFIYVHSKLGPYWAIFKNAMWHYFSTFIYILCMYSATTVKILFPPKPTIPYKSRVSARGGTAFWRVPTIKVTAVLSNKAQIFLVEFSLINK